MLTRKSGGVQYYRRKSVKDPNKKPKTPLVVLNANDTTAQPQLELNEQYPDKLVGLIGDGINAILPIFKRK